jgi:protein-S-isoprenylcysteine O-methyltransferase Ste14
LLAAVLVNSLLIAIFGVQHSVMARPTFKRWWTRFIPQPIERSTYVLISNILMMLLMWQWRPMGGIAWDVTQPQLRWALHGLFAIGWLAVPAVSLLINHFDLFGTRQVWLHLRGQRYTHLPLRAHDLSLRAPSPLHRLDDRILGHTHHERRTPAVCRSDDGLHLHCHPHGRAKSPRPLRRRL